MTRNPRNTTEGVKTGIELTEGDKTISFSKIPTTEAEKTANKPPTNAELPIQLQSEAFDNYD